MRGARACGLCEATITPEDVYADRVVLFRSALYCPKCAVPVARIRRETLLYAASFDASEAHECSRCHGAIVAADLENARFTRHKGDLFCALCAASLKTLLAPASVEAAPGDEAVDICATCSGLVTRRDMESGASVVLDGATHCKSCREAATARKADATAPRGLESIELLPESDERPIAADAFEAEEPAGFELADEEPAIPATPKPVIEVEEFSFSSDEKETLPPERPTESQSKRAKKSVRPTAPTAPVEKSIGELADAALAAPRDSKKTTSKRVTRRSSADRPGARCGICAGSTGGSAVVFAEKTYCKACSTELDAVLKKTRMKAGAEQQCASCGEVAAGAGALAFSLSNVAYCEACVPEAQPIVESMVRDGVERRRRSARKPLVAAAAVLLVALVGGFFGLLHAEPAQPSQTALAAATERAEGAPAADTNGPANALLAALEQDLTHLATANGLAESSLAFEAVGPRDRASDRVRVLTHIPHPDGGQGVVRALVEYSVVDHHLERRLIRWLDQNGTLFEKNAPLALADGVSSFRLEWTRGAAFVDPTDATASGAEFAKKAPPRALRAVLVTEEPNGHKGRFEREIALAKKADLKSAE